MPPEGPAATCARPENEIVERTDALIGEWPARPELTEELTISDRGAGFGSAEHNREVEDSATAAVIADYEDAGWDVNDVSADKCGWDLTCTHPDRPTARVEVKGTSGNRPIVLRTANEIEAAHHELDWVLAVVTRAFGPELARF